MMAVCHGKTLTNKHENRYSNSITKVNYSSAVGVPQTKKIPIRVCYRTQESLVYHLYHPVASRVSININQSTVIRKTLNSIHLTMTTAVVPSTVIIGKPDVHHE